MSASLSTASSRYVGSSPGRPGTVAAGMVSSSIRVFARACVGIALALALLGLIGGIESSAADSFYESPPAWEPLLWGGPIQVEGRPQPSPPAAASDVLSDEAGNKEADTLNSTEADSGSESTIGNDAGLVVDDPPGGKIAPVFIKEPAGPLLIEKPAEFPHRFDRLPFRSLSLRNIPPIYVEPRLEGEGVWEWKDLPTTEEGWPVVYRTSYRPSAEYPNAIVHMLLFDMKRLSMRLYIGSAEPHAPKEGSQVESEDTHRLVAVTNALWKQKHSKGAGAIFRGEVLREMVPGMATLVVYKDGSVDILEWNSGIPVSIVEDARQLRHLIVKDGNVVDTVIKGGQETDSEIGLGYLLAEEPQYYNPYQYWGGYYGRGSAINYSEDWFIATRSAFGIRPDGNLVFAVGHHISTKDLAKALALAGCVRAIHGDANPHNVLGNLYYTDGTGKIERKAKVSPDQKDYTLRRYVNRSYTSDFFGFFLKASDKEAS